MPETLILSTFQCYMFFLLLHQVPECGYVHFLLSVEDEFDLRLRRVHVTLHIYADLWAYRVDVSFDVDTYDSMEGPRRFDAGFLPLCAVTLPGNLDRFLGGIRWTLL